MNLKDFMNKKGEQEEYQKKVRPFELEMLQIEEERKQALATINTKYQELLSSKRNEMLSKFGSMPNCEHNLILVTKVLVGDYFDEAKDITYCLCCGHQTDISLGSTIKRYIHVPGRYNEEEYFILMNQADKILQEIANERPDMSIDEIEEYLRNYFNQSITR